MRLARGSFRRVLLVGAFAVKLPRLRWLLPGMRCNRWEREMWRTWRPRIGWRTLCPVRFADPLGLIVIMPRVQPATAEDVERETPDDYPQITCEFALYKDWGWLNGRVVSIDYGLWDSASVLEKRGYYAKMLREGRCRLDIGTDG